jgi:hypothetical protein
MLSPSPTTMRTKTEDRFWPGLGLQQLYLAAGLIEYWKINEFSRPCTRS